MYACMHVFFCLIRITCLLCHDCLSRLYLAYFPSHSRQFHHLPLFPSFPHSTAESWSSVPIQNLGSYPSDVSYSSGTTILPPMCSTPPADWVGHTTTYKRGLIPEPHDTPNHSFAWVPLVPALFPQRPGWNLLQLTQKPGWAKLKRDVPSDFKRLGARSGRSPRERCGNQSHWNLNL